jgi:ERCC4-type nuclease
VHVDDQRFKKREYKEMQLDVLSALPGVGPEMAKALMKKHGTLKALLSAESEDLGATAGIDEAKAEVLTKLFELKG